VATGKVVLIPRSETSLGNLTLKAEAVVIGEQPLTTIGICDADQAAVGIVFKQSASTCRIGDASEFLSRVF
jgi:hypothetical protein